MPSSSAVFRSFLVASFKSTKYPSIAALWYLDISKKNRRGLKPLFQSVLHLIKCTDWSCDWPKQTMGSLGVNVSAAQSHKTKAKSRSLLMVAVSFFPHFKPTTCSHSSVSRKPHSNMFYVLLFNLHHFRVNIVFTLCNLTNRIKNNGISASEWQKYNY